MKTLSIQNLFKILTLAVILSVGVTLISADYEPPTAPPPFDNAPAPIHTGPGIQTKEGSLAIEGESGFSGFRVGGFFGDEITQSSFDFVADDVFVNADGEFFGNVIVNPMAHSDTATEHIACFDDSGRLSDCGDITGSAEDPQHAGLKVCMGRLEGSEKDVWLLNVMDSWTERDCNTLAASGFMGPADRFALGCLAPNALRRGNWANVTSEIAGSPAVDCGWNSAIPAPVCTVSSSSSNWCSYEEVGFNVSCTGGYTPFTYSWSTNVSHASGSNSPAIVPPSTVPSAVFDVGVTYDATVSGTGGSSTNISVSAPRRYLGSSVTSVYRITPTVVVTNNQGVSTTVSGTPINIENYLTNPAFGGTCPAM